MLGKAPTPIAVALLLGFGVVFATPFAGAVSFGVDAYSVPQMKQAGVTPAYGQTWVGPWMRHHGYGAYEQDLRTVRDNGGTPVVMWYYWGDGISRNAVTYGSDGKSRSEWESMAKEMASRANSIMGSRQFLVVLEPEFNKNGISDWETFDGYLEQQARIIKQAAPNAKIVVGFGHWGGWEIFDRAVAASDMVGFQWMRGSTRDSSSSAVASADTMISIAKTLKGRFGKDVLVFDLAIATHGGWEWVQEAALQQVIRKRADLDAAGVEGIIWRYVWDNDYSSGYYGAAESTWGVKYRWGGEKKAYDELITLLKGSTSSSAPAPAPVTSAPSTSTASFHNVKGNEWWAQADVSSEPSRVEIRVNGGPWMTMAKAWWGSWTKSTHMPHGSTVELKATWSSGATSTTAYRWPDATPTTGSAPTPSSGFDATFRGVKVHEWWVQADVDANEELSGVAARVNGGAWVPLTKQWWGSWAKSIFVPAGGKVEFRATGPNGATDVSGPYWR